MLRVTALICLMSITWAANSAPVLNVGAMYEIVDGDRSTQLKRVRNNGDSTAFVRVEVREVTYSPDGKKQETRIDAQDAAKSNIDGLIFTPGRMIIPAKGMQSGRLVVTGNRDRERYYRVRFIPVMPKDKNEFGQSQKEFDEYSAKVNAGISVLTGYGVMVIVHPKNPQYKTVFETQGNKIIVHNKGNSSVSLEDIKQCKSEKCSDPVYTIVRPGSRYELKKEINAVTQFTLLEGKKKTPKSFG
ncbi:hypothetical protein [Scandinavium sp.]|uniref:fimbrial biogenesis chaperone n=1 Tax=Scandinavium sp. TaxID=2830653 RepID=UPI00289A9E0C|nr:hypothetical protein [Scandinavium sp.]